MIEAQNQTAATSGASADHSAAPALFDVLAERLCVRIRSFRQLGGGASKETWIVETDSGRFILRRAGAGKVYSTALSLRDEFRVLEAAYASGVRVPRPLMYAQDLCGREAIVSEHVEGETIGRRIVRNPPDDLAAELGEELAKIHAISPAELPFLSAGDSLEWLEAELDATEHPRPAIEYGLAWLREHRPVPLAPVVSHGDFRIGNVVVSRNGLEAVLDWELATLADPREDLAWPMVRAWRFGRDELRVGGAGNVQNFLGGYAARTGRIVAQGGLHWFEVLGNAKWAIGSITQANRHLSRQTRDVELAVLGRLAAEVEHELLDLIDRGPLA